SESLDNVLVTDAGRFVGIFTDRDAVLKVAGGRSDSRTPVGELMTADPVVLRRDDPIAVAINKMAVGGFRHVPIVDRGDPVSVVSGGAAFAIVDLTARAYDGVDAVGMAVEAGARVLAVGQHDDTELRKRAFAAGAERVLAYRKLFEDGPAVLAAWMRRPPDTSPRR